MNGQSRGRPGLTRGCRANHSNDGDECLAHSTSIDQTNLQQRIDGDDDDDDYDDGCIVTRDSVKQVYTAVYSDIVITRQRKSTRADLEHIRGNFHVHSAPDVQLACYLLCTRGILSKDKAVGE
jgi:hypothetical protein